MKKFLNNKEAAKELGVSPQTMRKIRNSRGFQYTRLGRKILIDRDFLLEYINNHKKINY